LLEVDPQVRLTAQTALEHPWIVRRQQARPVEVDVGVVKALHQFSQASKFRRCCMEMMAWSLSNDDRAKVCEDFLSLDTDKQGTISLAELRAAMASTLCIPDEEVERAFAVLDSNCDKEICYSEFLAAMVSSKIDLNDELLHSTFRRFDTKGCGYITLEGLQDVAGDTFQDERVDEAPQLNGGHISYSEFAAYLRGSSAAAEVAYQLTEPALEVEQPLEGALTCLGANARTDESYGWKNTFSSIQRTIAGLRTPFGSTTFLR